MRAALCRAYGKPETVTVEEIEPPALRPGQVRVRVGSAALNFPDILLVAGTYQIKVPPPFVPGSELVGEVIEVADDVTSLTVGQHVFGSTLVGAFAEEAAVAARSLTVVPAGVEDRTAAAFGVGHRTAYHVVRSVARLEPGDDLVVLGAGGGVGLATVQIGAVLGAAVTAVASSPEKLEIATALGASHVVEHRRADLREALREALPEGANVVVDPVGGALSEPALRSLRFGGRFVTVGYASGEIPRIPLNLVLLKGVHVLGFSFADFARHMPNDLERNESELMEMFASGRVYPYVGAMFTLEEVADALGYVAAGRAIGKVLIDVA